VVGLPALCGVLHVSVVRLVPLQLQQIRGVNLQDIFTSFPIPGQVHPEPHKHTNIMAVNQPLSIHAKRTDVPLFCQPINSIPSAMTAQALALEKLGRSVNMDIFQELIDLDTPSDIFSRNVVSEYLVMAPETLNTMSDRLYVWSPIYHVRTLTYAPFSTHVNLSRLNTSTQSLRCASMVLGLTRIEKACARIEVILNLCIDLHYTGISLDQICEILGYVVKEAHSHFELARTAFSSFYNLPLLSPREDASDASSECVSF
jgi:hypothetical protein